MFKMNYKFAVLFIHCSAVSTVVFKQIIRLLGKIFLVIELTCSNQYTQEIVMWRNLYQLVKLILVRFASSVKFTIKKEEVKVGLQKKFILFASMKAL